uniref:Uncharacterized protein n=1 Tax=viral metagenome TaxID=1070528 RepID=A0A6C0AWP3_9ZZZZ
MVLAISVFISDVFRFVTLLITELNTDVSNAPLSTEESVNKILESAFRTCDSLLFPDDAFSITFINIDSLIPAAT